MLAEPLPTGYPHQPHFLRVEPVPVGDPGDLRCRRLTGVSETPGPWVTFTFDPFTGDESRPELPSLEPLDRASALRGEDRIESALCEAEWHVAINLWRAARAERRLERQDSGRG
ncbi:hypothetical protein L3Q65_00495 (plasmid) [Amycolatopsis sp. FU40]|uniref:hypothetical protein n=1 Tax=Amycolatopsis sp. FU40 TaxID=2914159 RepID=UPI001F319E07|nr:hypothetical protein [Amycolatopsis sp. FU40]UKD50807.1 hypothetical protein L3Q65_00495 [Amycolatopsis sp. FU40]